MKILYHQAARSFLVSIFVLFVSALTLSGCSGGGSSDDSAPPTPPSVTPGTPIVSPITIGGAASNVAQVNWQTTGAPAAYWQLLNVAPRTTSKSSVLYTSPIHSVNDITSGNTNVTLSPGSYQLVVSICNTGHVCTNSTAQSVTISPPPTSLILNQIQGSHGTLPISWRITAGAPGQSWRVLNNGNTVRPLYSSTTFDSIPVSGAVQSASTNLQVHNGTYSITVIVCNGQGSSQTCLTSSPQNVTVSDGGSGSSPFFLGYFPSSADSLYNAYLSDNSTVKTNAQIQAISLLAGSVPNYFNQIVLSFATPNKLHSYSGLSHNPGDLVAMGLGFQADSMSLKEAIRVLKLKNVGTQVLLALGGPNNDAGWSGFSSSDATQLAQLVSDLGLDGIYIDYQVSGTAPVNLTAYYQAIALVNSAFSAASKEQANSPRISPLVVLGGWATGADCTQQAQDQGICAGTPSYWVGGNAGRERLLFSAYPAVLGMINEIAVQSYDMGATHYDPLIAYSDYTRIAPALPIAIGLQQAPETSPDSNPAALLTVAGLANQCPSNAVQNDQYDQLPVNGNAYSVARFAQSLSPGDGMMLWSLFANDSNVPACGASMHTVTDIARGVSKELSIGNDTTTVINLNTAKSYGISVNWTDRLIPGQTSDLTTPIAIDLSAISPALVATFQTQNGQPPQPVTDTYTFATVSSGTDPGWTINADGHTLNSAAPITANTMVTVTLRACSITVNPGACAQDGTDGMPQKTFKFSVAVPEPPNSVVWTGNSLPNQGTDGSTPVSINLVSSSITPALVTTYNAQGQPVVPRDTSYQFNIVSQSSNPTVPVTWGLDAQKQTLSSSGPITANTTVTLVLNARSIDAALDATPLQQTVTLNIEYNPPPNPPVWKATALAPFLLINSDNYQGNTLTSFLSNAPAGVTFAQASPTPPGDSLWLSVQQVGSDYYVKSSVTPPLTSPSTGGQITVVATNPLTHETAQQVLSLGYWGVIWAGDNTPLSPFTPPLTLPSTSVDGLQYKVDLNTVLAGDTLKSYQPSNGQAVTDTYNFTITGTDAGKCSIAPNPDSRESILTCSATAGNYPYGLDAFNINLTATSTSTDSELHNKQSTTKAFSISAYAPPVWDSTTTLADANVNTAYDSGPLTSHLLFSTPTPNALTFTKTGGDAWLTMNGSHVVANAADIPAAGTVGTITVQVTDPVKNQSAIQTFTVKIAGPPVWGATALAPFLLINSDNYQSNALTSFLSTAPVGVTFAQASPIPPGDSLWLSVQQVGSDYYVKSSVTPPLTSPSTGGQITVVATNPLTHETAQQVLSLGYWGVIWTGDNTPLSPFTPPLTLPSTSVDGLQYKVDLNTVLAGNALKSYRPSDGGVASDTYNFTVSGTDSGKCSIEPNPDSRESILTCSVTAGNYPYGIGAFNINLAATSTSLNRDLLNKQSTTKAFAITAYAPPVWNSTTTLADANVNTAYDSGPLTNHLLFSTPTPNALTFAKTAGDAWLTMNGSHVVANAADIPTAGTAGTITVQVTDPVQNQSATQTFTVKVAGAPVTAPGRVVGYLQTYVALPSGSDIASAGYTHVDVAFGLFSTTNVGTIYPTMNQGPPNCPSSLPGCTWTSYFNSLHAAGLKVLLSIGGASTGIAGTSVNFNVGAPNQTAATAMVTSIEGLINQYGFDGIDFDIEHGLTVPAGQTFAQSLTDANNDIGRLAYVINTLHNRNNNLLITLAPQVANVNYDNRYVSSCDPGNCNSYGNGLFSSLIMQTHAALSWVNIQLYNAGPSYVFNSNRLAPFVDYSVGTYTDPGINSAMSMVEDWSQTASVPPANPYIGYLRPDQIVLGYPATNGQGQADGSPPANIPAIGNTLLCLKGFSQYCSVLNPDTRVTSTFIGLNKPYTIGGVMDWDITHDQANSYLFATQLGPCVKNLTEASCPHSPSYLLNPTEAKK